jgi:hypothetical protein
MNMPGFTAEQTLHIGRAYRRSPSARVVESAENSGAVVPQFSCQQQCVSDGNETYHDCVLGCDGNSLCDSRCKIAFNNYVAKCVASCPKL